jgi:hypothetical protein
LILLKLKRLTNANNLIKTLKRRLRKKKSFMKYKVKVNKKYKKNLLYFIKSLNLSFLRLLIILYQKIFHKIMIIFYLGFYNYFRQECVQSNILLNYRFLSFSLTNILSVLSYLY